jgi:exopolysaccharide biosynthesis protein
MSFKVSFFALFVLLLTAAPLSSQENLDKLTHVSHEVQGGVIRLTLTTEKNEPQPAVYFASAPDRLVVELNETLPTKPLGAKPDSGMVTGWTLEQSGLNRARLTVNLAYRPPYSALQVKSLTSPPRVIIEFPEDLGVREKLALTEGITWLREDRLLAGNWTRINRLLFDPKDPHVEVLVGLAKEKTDAREALTDMVRRYDAVAGVNGGFFAGSGGPLGLVYRYGKLVTPHVSRRPPRSGFGLTKDGRPLFGRLAAAGPLIKDLDGGDWSKAWLALGGGPRLLKAGAASITADLEELGPKGNDITRLAARTLVGLDKDGLLTFATVSGYRDNHREGVQFGPLVGWLKTLGIQDAVNFDGGASVDMVVGSHIVSDGPANGSKEKPVATALLLKDSRKRLFPQFAHLNLSQTSLPADGTSFSEVSARLSTAEGDPIPDGTEVRFFARGARVEPALVKSKGGSVSTKLYSVKQPGTAVLQLMVGPITEEKRISMVGGPAKRLLVDTTKAQASEPGLQKATVVVQTVDEWGNGVPKQTLVCSLDGSEPIRVQTDANGLIAFDTELAVEGGDFAISHSGDLETVYRIPALD